MTSCKDWIVLDIHLLFLSLFSGVANRLSDMLFWNHHVYHGKTLLNVMTYHMVTMARFTIVYHVFSYHGLPWYGMAYFHMLNNLLIFSTHLPTSRRKLSRPTAVGRCVLKLGRRSALFRRLTSIQMLNRQSTLVCSRRIRCRMWRIGVCSVMSRQVCAGFPHNTTVGGNLANKKARHDHMTDLDIRLRPHIF